MTWTKSVRFLLTIAATATLGATPPQPPTTPLPDDGSLATATFAGGCFWCMEPPFDEIDGVVSTTSGSPPGAGRRGTVS